MDEVAAQRLSTSRHLSVRAVTPAIWMFGPVRSGAAPAGNTVILSDGQNFAYGPRPSATYRAPLTTIARLRGTASISSDRSAVVGIATAHGRWNRWQPEREPTEGTPSEFGKLDGRIPCLAAEIPTLACPATLG